MDLKSKVRLYYSPYIETSFFLSQLVILMIYIHEFIGLSVLSSDQTPMAVLLAGVSMIIFTGYFVYHGYSNHGSMIVFAHAVYECSPWHFSIIMIVLGVISLNSLQQLNELYSLLVFIVGLALLGNKLMIASVYAIQIDSQPLSAEDIDNMADEDFNSI